MVIPASKKEDSEKLMTIAKHFASHRYSWSDPRMAQNSDMNLYVLMKLMQGQLPDDEKQQLDGSLVTKVKTYFHEHVDSLEMSQEGILMRKVPGIAGEERRLILLPQLFHREVILNAHDRQGHQ